jgi:dipeptidyl-peptidase 4
MLRGLLACLLFASVAWGQSPLVTKSESTKYQQTSTNAEVISFCEQLAKQSPTVQYSTFAKSTGGNPMPVLVLGAPKQNEKKPVVLLMANIHGGEVDAKEALLMLARDWATEKNPLTLRLLTLVIVPNFNPDGNDAFSEKNRTDQNGPKSVGLRANGGGFDLNRDFVKLETPECRGLVELLNKYDPLMVVDGHTTNGSYHRYTLTYDGPRVPAADPDLIKFSQDTLLPAVGEKVKKATGFDSFTYGDFDAKHEMWETYGSGPRFGTQLYSLRGSFGILSESYTYASFEDRVKASYAFIKGNVEYVTENLAKVKAVVDKAQKPREKVALRSKTMARDKVYTIKGWVEKIEDKKIIKTDAPKDYDCRVIDKLVPTLEVTRPYAYLIPAEYTGAVDTLRRHGIVVDELREQITLETESYTLSEVNFSMREFQKHKLVTVEGKAGPSTTKAEPGMFVVKTEQKLGQLACYLLEPFSEDGLTTWNSFDAGLKVGNTFPVVRLPKQVPLFTGAPKSLPEKQTRNQPFTLKEASGFSLAGQAVGELTWLDDGEHWLQTKEGKLWKIHARSGKPELFVDAAVISKVLGTVKGLEGREVQRLAGSPRYKFTKDRNALLYSTSVGLVFVQRDGSLAKVLVPAVKGQSIENPTFSPDGAYLAYTCGGNLHVMNLATSTETALTSDGGKNDILNGRADWVYEEEIYNRVSVAFWWKPDSKQIAFLRFDDSAVPKFTLASQDGKPEAISYPKAGEKNPTVKLGVVSITEPKPVFVNVEAYGKDELLFARCGWTPTNQLYAYVQNRVQTWLDVTVWDKPEAAPKVLFRDTTKAWIEDTGAPRFLKDGTFLVFSERSGFKHLYHYAADGKLLKQLTDGPWEVKEIERIDEASGDIYFSCNKVRSTATHLALVALAGGDVQVISHANTTHTISLAPKGTLYVDRVSDDNTPTQTILRDLLLKPVRILDTNPVHDRAKYAFGKYERRQIKLADGFELEAGITYPPGFHELNRYPVWIMTYAGPHAPTVKDGWGSGRVQEQILASHGVIVLRVDPRSASGKGAQSAWTCYKQLGVQELKDLEEAVDWMAKNPWVDASRVGLSGHSYGGFMTSYALTHSKKFSAGVAGAPVTDWKYYDSIYTERYMGLPSENKTGYEQTSVVKAAKNLHGQLYLVHGLIDDNVHPQNSLQLATALHPRSVIQHVCKVFGLPLKK